MLNLIVSILYRYINNNLVLRIHFNEKKGESRQCKTYQIT